MEESKNTFGSGQSIIEKLRNAKLEQEKKIAEEKARAEAEIQRKLEEQAEMQRKAEEEVRRKALAEEEARKQKAAEEERIVNQQLEDSLNSILSKMKQFLEKGDDANPYDIEWCRNEYRIFKGQNPVVESFGLYSQAEQTDENLKKLEKKLKELIELNNIKKDELKKRMVNRIIIIILLIFVSFIFYLYLKKRSATNRIVDKNQNHEKIVDDYNLEKNDSARDEPYIVEEKKEVDVIEPPEETKSIYVHQSHDNYVFDYSSSSYFYETLKSGTYYYVADNLKKTGGLPWVPKANGYSGVGEYIDLSGPYDEHLKLEFRNGFQNPEHPDYYEKNCRVKKLLVTCSQTGKSKSFELPDTKSRQILDVRSIIPQEPSEKLNLRIEIQSVYKGNKYDDLCIDSIIPNFE